MKIIQITATTVLIINLVFISHVTCAEDNETTAKPPRSETIHLYLLAIPESAVAANAHKYRQDDDDSPVSFAETSTRVGQIISGVLGGDFRPIFAGSVKFVEEPMAQQNLGSFLGTIAPALNLALKHVYTRAQTALGLKASTTTPKPTPSPSFPQQVLPEEPEVNVTQPLVQALAQGNANSSLLLPSDYVLVQEGGKGTGNITQAPQLGNNLNQQMLLQQYASLIEEQKILEQQLLQLQIQQLQQQLNHHQQLEQQQQKEQQNEQKAPPTSTTAWEYILSQVNGYTTTTPEPLPLIRLRSTLPPGGDDDDDSSKEFKH